MPKCPDSFGPERYDSIGSAGVNWEVNGSYLEGGVLFGSKQVARKFFQAYMVLFVELSQIIADLLMSWVKVEL
jgi:hypothetical protein